MAGRVQANKSGYHTIIPSGAIIHMGTEVHRHISNTTTLTPFSQASIHMGTKVHRHIYIGLIQLPHSTIVSGTKNIPKHVLI
jgi:hypothetical protein